MNPGHKNWGFPLKPLFFTKVGRKPVFPGKTIDKKMKLGENVVEFQKN